MIRGLGGNRSSIENFKLLKDRFLELFSSVIESLDNQKNGTKKAIIAANYAVVFDAAIASKKIAFAFKVFTEFFFVSPRYFISQLIFINKGRISRKLLKS